MRPLMLITARVSRDRTIVQVGVHDLDQPDHHSLVAEFNESVLIRPPDDLTEIEKWACALLRLVAADVELTRMRRTALGAGVQRPTFTPHSSAADGAHVDVDHLYRDEGPVGA